MRLATWNCNMALHRKFDAMLRLAPDIAIICECAEPRPHLSYRLRILPKQWLVHVRELAVGTFEDWCGAGLSDHVPIVVDIDL